MKTQESIQGSGPTSPIVGQADLRLVEGEMAVQSDIQQPSLIVARRCRGRTIGEMLQGSLLGRPDLQIAINEQIALQRSNRQL